MDMHFGMGDDMGMGAAPPTSAMPAMHSMGGSAVSRESILPSPLAFPSTPDGGSKLDLSGATWDSMPSVTTPGMDTTFGELGVGSGGGGSDDGGGAGSHSRSAPRSRASSSEAKPAAVTPAVGVAAGTLRAKKID